MGAFHIVPNKVGRNLTPDQIFAYDDDEYDLSIKNGVIWAHRGGNKVITSDVTIKQATPEKFNAVLRGQAKTYAPVSEEDRGVSLQYRRSYTDRQ